MGVVGEVMINGTLIIFLDCSPIFIILSLYIMRIIILFKPFFCFISFCRFIATFIESVSSISTRIRKITAHFPIKYNFL